MVAGVQTKEYSWEIGLYGTRVIETVLREFFEKHKDEIETSNPK